MEKICRYTGPPKERDVVSQDLTRGVRIDGNRSSMEVLPFSIPEFCRLSWVSEAARQRWESTIVRGRELVAELEFETVRSGMRQCAIIAAADTELHRLNAMATSHGFAFLVLEQNTRESSYLCAWDACVASANVSLCLIGRPDDVSVADLARRTNDHRTLGTMLGYPECCISSYCDVSTRQGYIEPTWQMASESCEQAELNARHISLPILAETNILFRQIGLRPVFHFPCSFKCERTVEAAKHISIAATAIGKAALLGEIYAILRWPIYWSVLHGIAEVETPVFRVSYNSDATAHKYVVKILGDDDVVDEGAAGTRFPFVKRERGARRVIGAVGPRPAVSGAGARFRKEIVLEEEAWYYKDNGFASRVAMDNAHAPIVEAIAAACPQSILHLWCGNAALLKKCVSLESRPSAKGVEADSRKLVRGRFLLPDHKNTLIVGDPIKVDLFATFPSVDVVLLMIGRLTELDTTEARGIIDELRLYGATVIVYAFDDWLKARSLKQMGSILGLEVSVDLTLGGGVGRVVW